MRLEERGRVWALMELRAVARFGAANLAGGVLVFVFLTFLAPEAAGESSAEAASDRTVSFVTFVVFMAVALPVGFVQGIRRFRPARVWFLEARDPSPAEREHALRIPWSFALLGFRLWMVAAVVFGVLNVAVFENPARVLVRNLVAMLLAALTTSTLSYLLVEAVLRPLFAGALGGEAPERERYLGIRPRLMLSWALGSGVPLLAIAGVVAAKDVTDRQRGAIAFLAAVGVAVGWLLLVTAARSVSDPLDGMRAAVARVEGGDLAVEVPVDDGGEVGLLQAGFNRMVSGLRERRELEDLFGRHVGREVARRAHERQARLGGEVRDASVLFVDVVGSTSITLSRPAAEVVAMLNALFEVVVRAVSDEGGWVNKFEGDGAMCVFGALTDQPDHAARALRAARAVRAGVAHLRATYPDLEAGIGVSSGAVVAGNVGAYERYEYTVIGDAVNEAARLTDLAKERSAKVLASEAAVAAAINGTPGAEAAEGWRPAGTFTVRGRAAPTRAYEPA